MCIRKGKRALTLKKVVRSLGGFAAVLFLPASRYAQASIAGIVRDTSGAILPGVTVEASSPALIEKVRSAVSDGTGQYRIENLRPGVYSVQFTLAGFNTVVREGIEPHALGSERAAKAEVLGQQHRDGATIMGVPDVPVEAAYEVRYRWIRHGDRGSSRALCRV